MPRSLCAAALLLLATPVAAEQTKATEPSVVHGAAVRHDTSPPLSEMSFPLLPASPGVEVEVPIQVPPATLERTAPETPPTANLIPQPTGASSPSANLSFSALSDDDNWATVGTRIAPPDTNGDIGFDQNGNKIYIQYINVIWEIYDASGSSIAGPFAGNTFWSGFGGECQTTNHGDPLVLYDDDAGEWVFAQFVVGSGLMCFAISENSNPLGPYHRYAFQVGAPTGTADYPKIGVWAQQPDGSAPEQAGAGSPNQSAYTLMTRNFPFDSAAFTHSILLERDQMLTGAPAQFVSFSHPCVGGNCVEGQLPPHQAGPPPAFGTCPTFFSLVDAAYDDAPSAVDGVRLHRTCVDWQTTANSSMTESFAATATNFDRFLGNGFSGCISPITGGENLDCLANFSMYRAQYRFFDGSDGNGSHASVVLNTTVDADGSDRAGIFWLELRSTDGETGWSVHQEGIHAPGGSLERWMGSIAQDGSRNMALGYSTVSSAQDPSLHYAVREFGDTAGTLRPEAACHLGTGVQTASNGRWGDYSSMSVDPEDECTFWFTSEYYETTGSFDFNTRICSFDMCNEPPTVAISSPADGSSFDIADSISFAGSATDDNDDDTTLTGSLAWTSSLDGAIGSGGAFNAQLSAGIHSIVAAATDSGGLAADAEISISVTSISCPATLPLGPLVVSGSETYRAVETIAVSGAVTVGGADQLNLISGLSVSLGDGLSVEGGLAVTNTPDPCN